MSIAPWQLPYLISHNHETLLQGLSVLEERLAGFEKRLAGLQEEESRLASEQGLRAVDWGQKLDDSEMRQSQETLRLDALLTDQENRLGQRLEVLEARESAGIRDLAESIRHLGEGFAGLESRLARIEGERGRDREEHLRLHLQERERVAAWEGIPATLADLVGKVATLDNAAVKAVEMDRQLLPMRAALERLDTLEESLDQWVREKGASGDVEGLFQRLEERLGAMVALGTRLERLESEREAWVSWRAEMDGLRNRMELLPDPTPAPGSATEGGEYWDGERLGSLAREVERHRGELARMADLTEQASSQWESRLAGILESRQSGEVSGEPSVESTALVQRIEQQAELIEGLLARQGACEQLVADKLLALEQLLARRGEGLALVSEEDLPEIREMDAKTLEKGATSTRLSWKIRIRGRSPLRTRLKVGILFTDSEGFEVIEGSRNDLLSPPTGEEREVSGVLEIANSLYGSIAKYRSTLTQAE
ncbi:MAG: hypothetical protein HQL57_06615 [Magnetococcales bacterium]|nr:hypothetical protein [Magnetococcales bacterium]